MNYTALAATLVVFSLVLIALGCRRLWHARAWSAAANVGAGLTLLAAGICLFVVGFNLGTYSAWGDPTRIAELSFNGSEPHTFRVTLMRIPSGSLQVFNVSGEQWQLTL